MTTFSQLDPLWTIPIAFTVIALGLMLVWRGLRGGRDGNRALLGQRIDMLHRIEGFRLTVFGLVLIGVGAAVIWRAQWLLLWPWASASSRSSSRAHSSPSGGGAVAGARPANVSIKETTARQSGGRLIPAQLGTGTG